MGSSASTRSPRAREELRLLLLIAGEDHPKACTGRRLVRFGRAQEVHGGPLVPPPLLLDPHADVPISAADRDRVRRHGLLGVDCSWNRLGARGGYPASARWLGGLRDRRRLPWLIATNPQHFGRVSELNTAEAFAASAEILGWRARAAEILRGMPGGEAFWTVNARPLEAYRRCRDAAEVALAERSQFGGESA